MVVFGEEGHLLNVIHLATVATKVCGGNTCTPHQVSCKGHATETGRLRLSKNFELTPCGCCFDMNVIGTRVGRSTFI